MCAVSAPEIEIIGEETIYQLVDVPYIDPGARAKRLLADGTYRDVPVTTVSSAELKACNTLGRYEVQYEAVGPHGYTARARRCVEVGQLNLIS